VQGAMRSAGEKCTATSRVIVIESIAAEFVRRLVERVKSLEIGPGADAKPYLGPLISANALTNAIAHIERAQREGADTLCGGGRVNRAELANGHYLAPTVLDNVQPGMAIAQDEVFAPVLAILRVPDFDTA